MHLYSVIIFVLTIKNTSENSKGGKNKYTYFTIYKIYNLTIFLLIVPCLSS